MMGNKKRLIDADAFCKSNVFVCGGFAEDQYWNGYTDALDRVGEALEYFPAVDAVEVVRCLDCAIPHNKYTGCPKLNGLVTPPDFYCPYGERRSDV